MLRTDNVVSDAAKAAGLTFAGLGITPDLDGSCRPAISLALPRDGAVPEEERVSRSLNPRSSRRGPGTNTEGVCRITAPSASAIRPSVPTITRHQAKKVKPRRVTKLRNARTTIIAVMNDTTKPTAITLRLSEVKSARFL